MRNESFTMQIDSSIPEAGSAAGMEKKEYPEAAFITKWLEGCHRPTKKKSRWGQDFPERLKGSRRGWSHL